MNAISAAVLGLTSGCVSTQVNQDHPRDGSPPMREDDKDGHYVFAVGDNLTSRCNYLPSSSLFSIQLCFHGSYVFFSMFADKINAKIGEGQFGWPCLKFF